jgi:hypothetical protein
VGRLTLKLGASLAVAVMVTGGSPSQLATYQRVASWPMGGSALMGGLGLASFGAQCNGVHDDREALADAVAAVARRGGGTVWVPDGTCRIVATALNPSIVLLNGVTIRGRTVRSRLSLDTDDPGQFRQLFTVRGDRVSVERLRVVRRHDMNAVLISIEGSSGFTMRDVVLDGRKRSADGHDVAGVMLVPEPGQRIVKARLVRVTAKNLGYGVFQPNSALGETAGFTVKDSTFVHNWADDLEFNAPLTSMTDVRVAGSTFRHNRAPTSSLGAGIGVGLAHVTGALIELNTFRGYRFEPIHVEDRSADVVIRGNRFSRSGTAESNFASHVLVVGDVQRVRIRRNMFDATTNDNAHVDCIYLGAGGLSIAPDRVVVTHNVFRLGPAAAPVAQYSATRVTIADNIVQLASR